MLPLVPSYSNERLFIVEQFCFFSFVSYTLSSRGYQLFGYLNGHLVLALHRHYWVHNYFLILIKESNKLQLNSITHVRSHKTALRNKNLMIGRFYKHCSTVGRID